MELFSEITFENESFISEEIGHNNYEYCTFSKCDFTNAILQNCTFVDCVFIDCNFSMTKLPQSTLNNVRFESSKIMGVNFGMCHDFIFEVSFKNCVLDYSSFEKRKMSKTSFAKCSLKGVDFGHANLKQAIFLDCDLMDAIFYNTNLQEADFRQAYNYIINPDENSIKKASFSREGLAGLLTQYNITIE